MTSVGAALLSIASHSPAEEACTIARQLFERKSLRLTVRKQMLRILISFPSEQVNSRPLSRPK